MEHKIPKEQLRIVYGEVLRGYHLARLPKMGTVIAKHLNVFDTELVDQEREASYQNAVGKGLPTTKEKLEELDKEDIWTSEQEDKLKELVSFRSRLSQSKSKLILRSEIGQMNNEIDGVSKEINKLEDEKSELIGLTAEGFADKKSSDYYVYLCMYKDTDFKDPFFSKEEYDEIGDSQLGRVIIELNKVGQKFSQINLKRIALSNFFLNAFYLSEDNPFTFFGEPVVNLSYYQTDVFAFGKYFKHILSNMKHSPPEEVMGDPDKLIDAYNLEKNREKLEGDKEMTGTASTIVGATKDDLEALGMTPETAEGEVVSLGDAIAKGGGKLEMDDLIKLHGA